MLSALPQRSLPAKKGTGLGADVADPRVKLLRGRRDVYGGLGGGGRDHGDAVLHDQGLDQRAALSVGDPEGVSEGGHGGAVLAASRECVEQFALHAASSSEEGEPSAGASWGAPEEGNGREERSDCWR